MLKNVILLIITWVILTTTSFSNEVVTLNKGDTAPFRGALFSENKTNELRANDERRLLLEKKTITLEEIGVLSEQRLDIYKKRVYTLEETITKNNRKRFWSNIGHFLLGAALTGLAAKVAIESSK